MARRKYTPEFKREAVRLVREESMTYAQVGTDLGVDKSTIRDWCKLSEAGKLETSKAPGSASRSMEEENAALRREVRILREEREILKKCRGLLRAGDPVTTYRFIHAEEANHSVRTLCEVLTVARSAYNEWRKGLTHTGRRDLDAETRVRAVFEAHKGRYGAPRVAAELRMGERFPIGRKRVARLMRKFGMVARPRRRFRGTTTDSDHDLPVAENLLQRQFSVPAPKMAVVGDITYLPTRAGWVYLAVLIDLHSRKVVGWAMDTHMETELCLRAFDRMVASRGDMTGAIVHHDRGSQYASRAYRRRVEAAKMKLSMSRKGNCWDNAVAESFFGTLEQELAPDLLWADLEEARAAVSNYIHRYYNIKRRHSTLGYKTPVEFEANHQASRGIAA